MAQLPQRGLQTYTVQEAQNAALGQLGSCFLDLAASTVEPTGTSSSILTTGDGYKWKYMYTLSATQQANFLSTDFMAVATNSTVASAAVDGAVNIVKIKTAGSGGTNGTHTGVAIRGDGSGGVASVTVSGGAVTAVTVTSAGSGYRFAYICLRWR